MSSQKVHFGRISVCMALLCGGVAFFASGVNSESDPDRQSGGFGANLGAMMGGLMQNIGGGGLGGLGGFGGMGGGHDHSGHDHSGHDHSGHDHAADDDDDYEDDDEYDDDYSGGRGGGGGGGRGGGGSWGKESGGKGGGGSWGEKRVEASSMGGFDGIVALMNGAAKILGSLPDVKGMIPMVMEQGSMYVERFLRTMPGFVRSMRPEVQQVLNDAKEPVRKIAAMLKKTKRQLLGRNSWAENSVSLDLIERSLTFCPATNMTAIKGSRLPWDSFEYQLLDRCVEAGCDGKFDLCCPYVDPGTYGLIKANCVYSLKKHYGNCPAGFTAAFFDQDDIGKIMSTSGAFPTCKIDADCKVTERCCMKEDRSKEASKGKPLASCKEAVKKEGDD